ncbi:MAG: DNA polymerase [Desulfovibrionaceae bacterium]
MSLTTRLNFTEAPLYLMDGSAFVYRGFYANTNMQRSDGFPTNALFVVTRLLLKLLREEKPSYFLFLLDGKGKHFRHEKFPLYKANRDATPEALIQQLEPIERVVRHLGLGLEVSQNCEADDCIASLAARFSKERPVVIVGADKDLRQCLGPNVYMWDPASKDEKLLSAETFTEQTGLQPRQWPDVQALIGDTSDNIPGVPGIGPKTAEKIFAQMASLEDIRDNMRLLPVKLQQKLVPHVEAMFLYRELTTLSTNFCTHLALDDLVVRPVDMHSMAPFLAEFELHALRREMESMLRDGSLPPRVNGASRVAGPLPSRGVNGSPRHAAKVQQWNLFDAARPAVPPASGDMMEASPSSDPALVHNVADLPACADLPLALIPLPDRDHPELHILLLTVGTISLRYDGPLEALARYAAAAAQVVTPDVKALLNMEHAFAGVDLPAWFDLGIAAYVLDPEERDYGWPKLAAQWGDKLQLPANEPGPLALAMAAGLAGQLAEYQLDTLFYELEMPLVSVLAHMEQRGIAVDSAALSVFLQEVQQQLDSLTAEVYAQAGGEFNIRSAQQLGEVLFKNLQLPTAGKTRGGQLSTAQLSLEKLAEQHPVVEKILEFRKLEKLRSTYLEPLPKLMDAQGRLHSTFNQCATATGRLSSSNPNLQNIPVRGPLGKRMRDCFIAREGRVLVSADYSQVELRVLAHMSQEPTLLDAFAKGEDIHTRTAALIFDCAAESVTPEQRRNAKTINFGLIYGMGAQKLAQELKISTVQAKEFIGQYFEHMAQLKLFYEQVEASARELGLVTTLAGRRRLLPDMQSQKPQAFALARRQAINTVIQGSAADIIKIAMLAVQHDSSLQTLQANLVLQVHDELLLEVPAAHGTAAGQRVSTLMAGVLPAGTALSVPLVVDWGLGVNWGSAH